MIRVCRVSALSDYKIRVRFDDGVEGEVDLSRYVGKGVFAAWCDPTFFEAVHVSPYGSVAWSEDIELCPDSIYLELTGKKLDALFPRSSITQP